ncbi:MAG: agmatine deiminase family protein, partial [Myxococcales bacterium]|nr:agmatine deiminase family protein [Myxococcales bacterium]
RGDWEVPDRVLLVYTPTWPRTLTTIAEQVMSSGATVVMLPEHDYPRRQAERLVQEILRRHDPAAGGNIELFDGSVDTPWVRDWGPVQLRQVRQDQQSPQTLWLDASYDDDDRRRDDGAPLWLGQHYRTTVETLPWALDGGAFISNGAGLCMLSLDYLDLEGLRWDDAEVEQLLGQLGCRATALIPTLLGEETKHADMIAQFVSPTRVMVAAVDPDADIDGAEDESLRLDMAVLGLRRAARRLDLELEVIRVPTPAIGEGPARSFVNGLHLEDRYLMPTYPKLGAAAALAGEAVQQALGDTPVVAVDASELILAGGALHCAALGIF